MLRFCHQSGVINQGSAVSPNSSHPSVMSKHWDFASLSSPPPTKHQTPLFLLFAAADPCGEFYFLPPHRLKLPLLPNNLKNFPRNPFQILPSRVSPHLELISPCESPGMLAFHSLAKLFILCSSKSSSFEHVS